MTEEVRMMQIQDSDGEWHDYPLHQYIQEHPEDFYPVVDGHIVGAIPFDPTIFGQPDENGNIIVSSDTQISIEPVGDDDAVIEIIPK